MRIQLQIEPLKKKIVEILQEYVKNPNLRIYVSSFAGQRVIVAEDRNWFLRKHYLEIWIRERCDCGCTLRRAILVYPRIPLWNKDARIIAKKIEAHCGGEVVVREA